MPLGVFEAEPDPLGRLQRQRINKAGASNTGATSVTVSQLNSGPINMMVPNLPSGNLGIALQPTQMGPNVNCEKNPRCSGTIVVSCFKQGVQTPEPTCPDHGGYATPWYVQPCGTEAVV